MAKVGIIFKLTTALWKINKGRVSGEDESYFRKNFPCNARRKISGVGLVFREKSFSIQNISEKKVKFSLLNDFQLTYVP